ncbi:MAG: Ig-like domain-containing protein, partial [Opitutae bacterium]
SDIGGEIKEVSLYENGKRLSTDAIAPYEFLWGAGAQGYYDLYLMVTDNQGNKNVSEILRRDVFPSEPPSFTFQPVSPAEVSTDNLLDNGSVRTGDHNLTFAGAGYHVAPEVVITDSNGTGATGYALIDENGSVVDINITNGGQGYTSDASIRLSGGLDTSLNPIQLEFGKTLNLGIYAYDADTMINPLGFKVFINGAENADLQVSGNTPNYFLSWTPRFSGFFSIRVEGTTVDGEEASTSELDIEVYNENAHEISLYGLDSNVNPRFALGSMVHVPFEISTKFGQISNIRAFENDLEVGSFDASTGTAVNISYDQTKDQYSLSWTSSYDGIHSLYLRVDFDDGSTIYSNPSTFEIIEGIDGDQLPVVSLLRPLDGTSLTEVSSIRLEANASDADGSITQVEFYVDGELNATLEYNASYLQPNFVYGTTWSPDANGSYRIHAVAVDNGGNRVMSEVVTVSVVPGSDAPAVSLNDLSGTNFVGESVYLYATAADDASTGGDGVIERVRIFVNGQQVGQDLTAWPYEAIWTAPAAGFYQVYAMAEDNEGNVALSAEQNVTVRLPIGDLAPSITLRNPLDGTSLTEVSSIRLEANASDADGS